MEWAQRELRGAEDARQTPPESATQAFPPTGPAIPLERELRSGRQSAVVVAGLEDDDVVAVDEVHEPVLLVDAA